jgi:hypothetical protein
MELFLNAAWLALAVASYALLFWHLSSRNPRRAPGGLGCVVALGCILAILFPVISLTDDLHDMQATVEESSTSCTIMKKCGVASPSTPPDTSHHLPYTVSSAVAAVTWTAPDGIATQALVRPSQGLLPATPGRAPPLFCAGQFS